MESTQYLYFMLSHTGTGIGKAIRFATNYDYNHVSLCLDPDFRKWVSFARYVQDVPLAGGFVQETPERFLASGACVPVRIFRVEISESRYRKLNSLFSQAGQPDCGLIYNSIGAVLTFWGINCSISGAYTCLEFANIVLKESHRSIEDLDVCHRDDLIYAGDLRNLVADTGARNDTYFLPRGLVGGTADTLSHFAALFRRMLHRRRPDLLGTSLQ